MSSSPFYLRSTQVGPHWGKTSPEVPSQAALPFNARAQLEADQSAIRQLFAEMVRKAGGVDWLAKALGREDSYSKKITGAINAEGDRKVQTDWLAPMLDDPRAAELLVNWINDRCGYAPPVLKRPPLTPEQTRETVTEVVAEMDPIVREGIRAEVARRRGVKVDEVKL